MTIRSVLTFRILPGQRQEAAKAFMQLKVLDQCAAAIPGFIDGQLLLNTEHEDDLCVITNWHTMAAVDQWQDHPVRQAQEKQLFPYLAQAPRRSLYETFGSFSRPSTP